MNDFRYRIADRIKPRDKNSKKLEEKKASTNVIENLRKIGINAHKLSINAIRDKKTYLALREIQDLDLHYMCGDPSIHMLDNALTIEQFKESKKTNGIVLNYHGYLMERANLIINLVHTTAAPYGRGGDFEEYADRVIAFNRNAVYFRRIIQNKGRNCAVVIDYMYDAALAILTYSRYDKDMSLNDVLVHIGSSNNQLGNLTSDDE